MVKNKKENAIALYKLQTREGIVCGVGNCSSTSLSKCCLSIRQHSAPFVAAELLSDLEGAFQEKIDVAYFDTSKYLLDVLNRNYLLLEHLQAMRRYLLLGQGDFIRHLMDLLKLAESPLLQQQQSESVYRASLSPGQSWCVPPPRCTSTI